jgi:hypothetical protein
MSPLARGLAERDDHLALLRRRRRAARPPRLDRAASTGAVLSRGLWRRVQRLRRLVERIAEHACRTNAIRSAQHHGGRENRPSAGAAVSAPWW